MTVLGVLLTPKLPVAGHFPVFEPQFTLQENVDMEMLSLQS